MAFLNKVLGLEEFFNKSVRTLSLGQRMRADLGAALLHNPKVLYLDEPTIGLDLVVKDNIRQAIKEINEKYQTTVVLTTHDIGDIEELCNRIIIIDKGKLIYDGSLEHLKDTYGKKRSISFVVKDCNKINLKELLESYSFHKEAVEMEMEEEESTINFTFDKNAVAVSDIIAYVMDVTEVKDMNIRETDLGEIVKEIYHNGMSVEDGEA